MPELIVTRGLPASGKTTRAVAWVAENPAGRARVNRDSLRTMLHGGYLGTESQETVTSMVQRIAVSSLLHCGASVIVDDTNLPDTVVADWRRLAGEQGARFEVWDFTHVPVDECVRRDGMREGATRVGEHVIRGMHERHLAERVVING